MWIRLNVTLVGAFLIIAGGAQAGIPPSDADVRKILADRVDALGGPAEGVGAVIGVVGPEGQKVFSYGRTGQKDRQPLGGDTLFEIASVTKVFTALLLAEMVRNGEVALADPVAKYLPQGVKVPERNGRSITLLDFATHTSGLPFMPEERFLNDPGGAKDSKSRLFRFLAQYELPRDIGARRDYSNIGYWLLGEALAFRAGMDFENLLHARVIAPLKLKNTAITLSPKMKARLAVGLTAVLQPAPSLSTVPMYADMAAAGNLVSTANDLLTLLKVALGYERSPLAPAITAMLTTRLSTKSAGESQALGWVVLGGKDEYMIFHDGGSLGSASAVAWDPGNRVGVVVLLNQATSVSDIARHLLRPDFPLARPTAVKRTEIALDSTVLDDYAGHYEMQSGGVIIVARDVGYLSMQTPTDWGLPKLRLRAESHKEFFVAEFPIRVTVDTDSDGRVSGLLIDPGRGKPAVPARRKSPAR